MKHEMILFSADMKSVHARLAQKFNAASLAQQAEQRIRTPQIPVRVGEEAPESEAV